MGCSDLWSALDLWSWTGASGAPARRSLRHLVSDAGLFQIKLDGDPKKKVQIVELIKSSDNKDERDNLRVGDVVLRISSGASKHEYATPA